MSRVNVSIILDQITSEVRSAMRATFAELGLAEKADSHAAARLFVRRLKSRCGQWTNVSSQAIEDE